MGQAEDGDEYHAGQQQEGEQGVQVLQEGLCLDEQEAYPGQREPAMVYS